MIDRPGFLLRGGVDTASMVLAISSNETLELMRLLVCLASAGTISDSYMVHSSHPGSEAKLGSHVAQAAHVDVPGFAAGLAVADKFDSLVAVLGKRTDK